MMAETVTVTPTGGDRYNSDGDPIAPGEPVTLVPIEVAPGNSLLTYGIGGDLDDVQFTVYLELGSPIANNDIIEVRGRECRARVALWDSSGYGGLAVLARSTTGATR